MDLQIWDREIPYLLEGAETPNAFHTYLLDTEEPLPCIVVLPGGGYSRRAPHEGAPIAEFFNSQGFHAVVVDYRVAPNRYPAPLADAQRVIKILRYHAKEWKIAPNRIVTCGFSAGGHLCGSTLLFPDVYASDVTPDAIDAMDCTPNGGILCYPVISVSEPFGHCNSGKKLLGEERYEREQDDFCLQKKVTATTPKAFLWHTSTDEIVNVKNSLVFGEMLRDNGIPFEMHVFPEGRHGLGLAKAYPDISEWARLAANWVKRNI